MVEQLRATEISSKNSSITVFFGEHARGENYDRLAEKFTNTLDAGKYPSFSAWEKSLTEKLKDFKPALIAVDSFSYDPRHSPGKLSPDNLFFFPGNPFEMRQYNKDLYILAGDFPQNALVEPIKAYDKILPDENAADAVVSYAISKFYEKFTGFKVIEDPNKRSRRDIIFSTTGAIEVALSAGIAVKSTEDMYGQGLELTRRQFLAYSAVSLAGGINCIRSMGYLFDPGDKAAANKPLLVMLEEEFIEDPDDFIKLRNALVSIKLNEADSFIRDGNRVAVSKAVVFGYRHERVKDVMKDQNKQKEIVAVSVAKVLENIDYNDDNFSNREKLLFKDMILRRIIEVFGTGAVWVVKEPPKVVSEKSISAQIPMELSFISPVIRKIVVETAMQSGFTS